MTTPGVDGTTIDGLGGRRIGTIIESLKDESFQPHPARREDFIIGISGSKADAEKLKANLTVFLEEKLKLKLSDTKTKSRIRIIKRDSWAMT